MILILYVAVSTQNTPSNLFVELMSWQIEIFIEFIYYYYIALGLIHIEIVNLIIIQKKARFYLAKIGKQDLTKNIQLELPLKNWKKQKE